MIEREIFVLGVSHRTAPLAVRELLALGAEAERGFAAELAGLAGLAEFVVINTCNRVEIYGVSEHATTIDRLVRLFCRQRNFDPGEFKRHSFIHLGRGAVEHLLATVSGLDSQVVGETEILGQIKRAYATAQERRSAGPVLNRLFQKSFQAAKQVRSQTAITSGAVSLANVAVDLALKIFGSPSQGSILLLGAGEMGAKCGRAFRDRGATSLSVASRSRERTEHVAAELGATAMDFESWSTLAAGFDIIVTSTSAPAPLVTPELVRQLARRRAGRPIFLIDLSLPRNVDPAVAEVENVFAYDLDDLARIAAENRALRLGEIARCEELLASRAAILWPQLERDLNPTSRPERPASSPFPALQERHPLQTR